MAETDQDQKTEQPTEKRRAEATERGEFARSQEISVLFPLTAAIGALALTVPTAAQTIAEYSVSVFSRFATTSVTSEAIPLLLGEVMMTIGRAAAPVIIACAIASVVGGGIQSGFRVAKKALGFKPEKLNPVSGLQRLFSMAVLVRGGIDVLKLVAIAIALWLGTRSLIGDPLFTAPVEVIYLGHFLNEAVLLFLTRLLLALGIVAAISYAYEKHKHEKGLMMTHQEVKDEHKQAEGDAHTKAAMRRMARRLMQKQMLSAVPTADVVVTNPTHYAVALKYERGKDQAPVILAKGENRFAQRIKALAAEHGVPTVENKPVARTLFALGKVGEAIPAELYQAVAGILAVVYRTHRYYFHQLRTRRLSAAT